jgi:hypothetical protein
VLRALRVDEPSDSLVAKDGTTESGARYWIVLPRGARGEHTAWLPIDRVQAQHDGPFPRVHWPARVGPFGPGPRRGAE